LYFHRFMLSIWLKLREKNKQFPGQIHPRALEWSMSFKEFDENFTVPLSGFVSAEQYWASSSSLSVLRDIRVPTLLINAKDDPLLGEACYPTAIAAESSFVFFETPEHGGHVGFVTFNPQGEYWSETRTAAFLLDK